MNTLARGWTVDLPEGKFRIIRRERNGAFVVHRGLEMQTLPADHPALVKILATLAGRA